MFMMGTPVHFGYEILSLTSSCDYLCRYEVSTDKSSKLPNDMGLESNVITNMLDTDLNPINHTVFFDNFFTS